MAGRGGSGWRGVALWTGLLVLVGCLAVVGVALRSRGGLQAAASVAGLVSVVLVVPTLAVPLWRWWRRTSTPVVVLPGQVSDAKEVLAGVVAQQWRTEAMLRSLDDPDPMPVRWRLTRRSEWMDQPANLTPASLLLTARSDDLAALATEFRGLRRRRLVLLGGPGTGKTTLAVQLLRELLATRDAAEPVPVLVSVAGWDTDTVPHLHDWIATRLAQDYPALRAPGLGVDVPATLAGRGHVLPVLDGLDELPAAAQAKVITALNRSLTGEDQLVLTSRSNEFAAAVHTAGDVLTSAVVIEPEPLDPAAAADYLRRCLSPRPESAWEQILTALRSPTELSGPVAALAEVTSTALGLWLLRAVYVTPHTDPTLLLDPDRFPDTTALRTHLFDQLIPALIATRPPSDDPADLFRPRHHHDPTQVRRWLGYLAHYLTHLPTDDPTGDGAGTRGFAWWRLAHTTYAITRTLRLAVGLVNGLGFGGMATTWPRESESPPGFADLRVRGGVATTWPRGSPGFADLRVRGRITLLARHVGRNMLMFGLVFGFAGGLTSGLGLVFGFAGGLTSGLGLMFGLGGGFGFAVGLIVWVETPTQTERASTPMSSWHNDRALNLVRAIVGGLAFGLTGGLIGAIVGGLAFGLVFGEHRAWLAYMVATYQLARNGRLPRRLMPFLDDAHRLGLLRTVGPIYQFRHAELQDHLAATYHQPG